LAMVVALAMLAPVLAACGPTPEPEVVERTIVETVIVAGTPEVVEKIVTATPPPPELVTIKFTSNEDLAIYDPIVPDLIKERGLNVNLEMDRTVEPGGWAAYCDNVITRIAGGDVLDLIHMAVNGMFTLAGKGVIRPLDPFLEADTAFKKDVDDTRHSPALRVMELLLMDNVRKLHYNDPWVASVRVNGSTFRSKKLTPALLEKMDVVVITTDHSDYDYDMIVKHAKVVVDTRNATQHVKGKKKHVTVLGDGRK